MLNEKTPRLVSAGFRGVVELGRAKPRARQGVVGTQTQKTPARKNLAGVTKGVTKPLLRYLSLSTSANNASTSTLFFSSNLINQGSLAAGAHIKDLKCLSSVADRTFLMDSVNTCDLISAAVRNAAALGKRRSYSSWSCISIFYLFHVARDATHCLYHTQS